MKKFLFILFILISPLGIAQTFKSEKELKKKVQASLDVANLLYKYRVTEWLGIDFTEANENLSFDNHDYLVYEKGKYFYFILIQKKGQFKTGTYKVSLKNDAEWEVIYEDKEKKLNRKESKLYKRKLYIQNEVTKITEDFLDNQPNFSLSSHIIPHFGGYKLYTFIDSSIQQIIPIGNDGIFHTNRKGKIKAYEWFHLAIMAIDAKENSYRVATHKHNLQSFISPITLANFKLYGNLYGVYKMPILLHHIPLLLEYDSKKNKIEIHQEKK